MIGHCHGQLWRSDDFSACFRRDYLQTVIPLIACALSSLYLILQLVSTLIARYSNTSPKAYQSLPNGLPSEDSSTECHEEQEDDLTLRPALSRAGESVVTAKKPTAESLVTVAEEVCVLAVLVLHIVVLVSRWDKHRRTSAIAGVVVWAYIAVLATLRLVFTTSQIFSFRPLWYHTAALYGVLWTCYTLIFRSEIIHPHSQNEVALVSSIFALITVLLLIALTSRVGNRAVEVEYEGDISPAREPLASVLSKWTFTWVDGIVYTGYKKTVELSDVWNLPIEDKAAAVLADYRQFKKTSILAFHLLKYLRTAFLIQAAWAVIGGLMTFVPTLLLKVILQYVEDPVATPRNAAWLYVILLFVSGVFTSITRGQALWIGRKICIRLRAVIIGEIYAKALRRRAAATSDKVLGQGAPKNGGDETKQSLFKRVLSFGRKEKQKDQAKKEGDAAEGQVSSGAIINLMAVDSFKVAEISAYLHFLWAETPVQFVLAIVLLYQILGASSIVGIVMMALLLPVNMVIAKSFAAIQKKILAATDARIHTTNEVLTNIRIIKYFAWEQRFLGAVEEKRAAELKNLRNRYIVWAIAATVWSGAPVLITFLSFLFYTLVEKRPLIPSVAFTALSLFSLLRIPLDQLADMVAHVQESKVSVDRVEEYLNEPETDKYKQLRHTTDDKDDPVLGIENGTFSWGAKESDDFKLIDIDIKFKVSALNVVIGPTGSGKTSLLMALLGEMTLLEGSVFLPGGRSRTDLKPDPETGLVESVAYCAQQAWLINGTIRENILFSSDYDAARYKGVVVACSLQRDLEILDKGDQTIVGEKGVTLSGGQKQRISLARALYSNARHLLLDDVLSAVDSHTAKWIFDKAIHGPLMYHRTCILVTHNATLCLPQAAFAVVLDNGRITAKGTAVEVIKSGKLAEDISKFELTSPTKAASTLPSRVPSNLGVDELPADQANGHDADTNGATNGNDLSKITTKDIPGLNALHENDAQGESKATGGVKVGIIAFYLRSMGSWPYWFAVVLIFTLGQASQVSTNIWVKEWANAYLEHDQVSTMAHDNSTQLAYFSSAYACLRSASCILPVAASSNSININMLVQEVNVGYYLAGYAVLGGVFMLVTFSRELVLFAGSLAASKRIHQRLMEGVTHAKFRFFDSTPLGQIMNRFSKDIQAIDQEIAPVAVGVVHCTLSILTVVILVSVITPGFLIAAVFISILYYLIGRFYIGSSRDLKRLESVQRSPLYQQFGETMSGMTTIRAYGEEERFIRDNMQRINTHSRPFIYLWAANRWLAFRVDVVGALVAFFSSAFIVLSVGRIDAGAAGLALTYALTFTENVLWFVRLYAETQQNMNAVERVSEYLNVDQEAALIVQDNRPPSDWPNKGSVEFRDYCARYRSDFDLVLRDISFKITAGEKVGVVGRTGAGKSSMALALFRALEAERGQILIDDMDISTIGLQDLRENIVMVPQDPTLFTGTIRNNLDPFSLFTDEEIFTALRRVQLVAPPSRSETRPGTPDTAIDLLAKKDVERDAAIALPASPVGSEHTLENKNIFLNLSSPIAESGSNLSQGQRQLLCLARALLKSPKVLLMDEATASIDYATDSKIQETIREIKNTTITIAHRLQTIIDYDKVLVLDKGAVVEYGDPYELLQQEDGIFRGMCDMTGELDTLLKEAKKAFDGRRLVDDS
ncbi:hypothetical protein AMS68_003909 [Peltaster fructicola]|uniref:Uncharacterized protein n=1 Tax=Peltaster fructicola TaxID=286661 RepID=A0A6H0XUG2_9PEZI|nr:hypothetical protein AMS68_003909 [Peltaster fructicola]